MTLREQAKRLTEIRAVVVEDCPDAQKVWFIAGAQQFCVTPIACESKQEADWMRDRLVHAIEMVMRHAYEQGQASRHEEIEHLHERLSQEFQRAFDEGRRRGYEEADRNWE